MNRKLFWLTSLLTAALLLSACSGLIPQSGEGPQYNEATQQAVIVKAVEGTATAMALQAEIDRLQTQVASGGSAAASATPSLPPAAELPTATLPPTSTPPPTNTPLPTATLPPAPTQTAVIPTQTPVVIAPTLLPSATPIPCNQGQFVKDVTIPDGSILTAGSNFTKTWQLKNTGACTWTTSYDVVFSSGDALGAPAAIDLPGSVAPGQVIDISIGMVAPASEGSYRGNWKLRDASGSVFGLGRSGAGTFYVDIKVGATTSGFPLNMVSSMCSAEWTSSAGAVSCPGSDGDSRGFVLRVDNPTLESGYVDDEPALLISPQMVSDGTIRGKYPSLKVESGYKFSSIIGCARGANGCDARIQLDYQIGSGPIQTLASWREVYDEAYNPVSVDLSSLAGYDARFILTVTANGAYNQDRVLLLAPRITK